MSRILSLPFLGNLKLYDVSGRIDMERMKKDYKNLTVDPYVKEGFRRKHIVRYRTKGSSSFERLPHKPLYQSAGVNPTHGDIYREYPEYIPSDEVSFHRVLETFQELAQVPDGENMLIQAQRITCEPDREGLPSVEGWHRDGVTKIAILCVDRYNVNGGFSQFRPNDDMVNVILMCLSSGQMVIFDDESVQHRVTPIRCRSETKGGYRDVMLFAYPDCST